MERVKESERKRGRAFNEHGAQPHNWPLHFSLELALLLAVAIAGGKTEMNGKG